MLADILMDLLGCHLTLVDPLGFPHTHTLVGHDQNIYDIHNFLHRTTLSGPSIQYKIPNGCH